jgi:hypothetical protein
MDAVRNPYGPGAGTPPPELSGRARILNEAGIGLERTFGGRSHKSAILVGLRGVGKTVLLNRIDDAAQALGFRTALIEVPEDRPLPQLLVPALRRILLALDRMEELSEAVKRALRVLRSFVGRFSVKMGEVELGLGIDPEKGTADSGDLDVDLTQLLVAVGEAARSRGLGVALIFDELQYLDRHEFAALIVALHRCAQLNLPLILFGAGLPTVRGIAGRAKSYAERLFDYPTVGPLSAADVADALQKPAMREGVRFSDEALQLIQALTQGYPYFVQEWAYQSWNAAPRSPIGAGDVQRATEVALERLDESFFRVRFDRLTSAEKRYLRAMAALGPGPYRSSDVATVYGAKTTSVAPIRGKLIAKGMIYSPAYGDAAFTVPLFDEFMIRATS